MDRIELDVWTAREVSRLLALVENEKRYYQEIIATIPVPLAVVARGPLVLSVNRSFRRAFGVRQGEVAHKKLREVVPAPGLEALVANVLEAGSLRTNVSVNLPDAEGVARRFRASVFPFLDLNDDTRRTALLVLEEPDQASQAATRLLDELGAVLWSIDLSTWQVEIENRYAPVMLGSESGTSWPKRFVPEDGPRVRGVYEAAAATGKDTLVEYRAVHANGTELWLCDRVHPVPGPTGRPAFLRVITTDQTAGRRHSSYTAQRRKIDAISRMSARLAHDFNNMLMAIAGNAELLLHSLTNGDERRQSVQEILDSVERCTAVSSQLVTIGRPLPPKLQTIELNDHLRRARLDVSLRLTGQPEPVRADPVALTEAIRALVAMAAVGNKEFGSVTLRTSRYRQYEDFGSPPAAGIYVRMTLGPVLGVTADLLEQWTEPMLPGSRQFSAVALAYQNLTAMGAFVTLVSEDRAHAFDILFPLVKNSEPAPAKTLEQVLPAAPEKVGGQSRVTILVVDDEESIRSLVTRLLQQSGYQVLDAGSSTEAQRISDAFEGTIELAVSDVMLPGIKGPELVKRIREKRPKMQAIFISGYSDDPALRGLPAGDAFLQKPFKLGALIDLVRNVLRKPAN